MSDMDYYEILGIRPSAGHEEIELAYKGRRSQYHPDRYAQADTETQAWATESMKGVNEAYEVLSDDDKRSRFDRKRGVGASGIAPAPAQGKSSRSLQQFLSAHWVAKRNSEKIFIAPNIPLKKVSGALGSYGGKTRQSEVVALIDDTVFGGAKDGVLFTNDEIRIKAIFTDPVVFKLHEIELIASEKNRIYVNGHEALALNVPDKRETEEFFSAVNEYIQRRKNPKPAAGSDAEMSRHPEPDRKGYALGEAEFLRSKQGIYERMLGELSQELSGASRSNRLTGGGRDFAKLLARLLSATNALKEFKGRNESALTDSQRKLLSSDFMRFEILIYQFALIGQILLARRFSEDDAWDLVSRLVVELAIPYVFEVEGLGADWRLKGASNPMAVLEDSRVMDMQRRRADRYAELFSDGLIKQIPQDFKAFLGGPCALESSSSDELSRISTFSYATVSQAISKEDAADLVVKIGALTNRALDEYFES